MEKDYSFTGYNKSLKELSRNLRKNMTEHERKLWFCFLKDYPVKFVRQRSLGPYIADFYCSKAKMIIEIDGSQHYTQKGMEYDSIRTEQIEQLGVTVLRFSNYDINTNFEGVCLKIDKEVSLKIGCQRFYEE